MADYYQTLTNNRNAPILVKDYFYIRELLETEFPDKVFPKQSFGKRDVDIFDPQFEKRSLFGMMFIITTKQELLEWWIPKLELVNQM